MALNSPALCHLLALPRELRDMIVDDVLTSSDRPSNDSITPCNPDDWSRTCDRGFWNCDRMACICDVNTHIPPLRPDAGLLQTCQQLRAETIQRAAVLDVSLVLDVLVLSKGHVQCTWLNIPCRRSWDGIKMKINVRIGVNSIDRTRQDFNDCSRCSWGLNMREVRVAHAIKTALLKTLTATDRDTAIVGLRIDIDVMPGLPRWEDDVEEDEQLKQEWNWFTSGIMSETSGELFGDDDDYDTVRVLEQVRGVEWWVQGALAKEWCFDRMLRDDEECPEFPPWWSNDEGSFKAWRRTFRKGLRGWE